MRFLYTFLLAMPMLFAQDMSDMPGMEDMPGMQHDAAPMQASGTSSNPASSPMDMKNFSAGGWNFTVHGVVFAVDTQQSGPRGGDKFSSGELVYGRKRRISWAAVLLRSVPC